MMMIRANTNQSYQNKTFVKVLFSCPVAFVKLYENVANMKIRYRYNYYPCHYFLHKFAVSNPYCMLSMLYILVIW